MRILFFGDSITQGFWSVDGGWVEQIRKHYDGLAVQDLRANKQPEIFNLGVSGDTTRNLLQRVAAETKARTWPGDPVVTVLAIGTNDDLFEGGEQWVSPDEFRANINKLVDILEPITDGLLFVGNAACDDSMTNPVFWGDYSYSNEQIQKFENIINEETKKRNIPFVPVFDTFKQKLDAGEELLADGLHPNEAGHQLIKTLVLPELQKQFG